MSTANQIGQLINALTPDLDGRALAMRPGALPAAIADCEQSIGCTVPTDLRSVYQLHDGQDASACRAGLLYDCRLLSLKEIARAHEQGLALARTDGNSGEDNPPGFDAIPEQSVRPVLFDEGWIPFASDGGGSFLFVDLSPGINGVAGQVIGFDIDYFEYTQVAVDLDLFLSVCACQYEAGRHHTVFTRTSNYASFSELRALGRQTAQQPS